MQILSLLHPMLLLPPPPDATSGTLCRQSPHLGDPPSPLSLIKLVARGHGRLSLCEQRDQPWWARGSSDLDPLCLRKLHELCDKACWSRLSRPISIRTKYEAATVVDLEIEVRDGRGHRGGRQGGSGQPMTGSERWSSRETCVLGFVTVFSGRAVWEGWWQFL